MVYENSLINIHFVSDDRYVLPLCVALKSILDSSKKEERFCFNVVDVGISEDNKDKISLIAVSARSQLRFWALDGQIRTTISAHYRESRALKKKYISSSAIAKFFIPLLDTGLEKTIYIDCDVIVCDSLIDCWNIDLHDHLAAVVPDLKLSHSTRNTKISFTNKDMYFNSGFMVMNLCKMRENNILQQYLDIALDENMVSKLNRFLDQDQFNLIFKGNIQVLPLKYNLFARLPVIGDHGVDIGILVWLNCRGCISEYFSIKDVREAIRNPVVVHFVTRLKPWTSCDGFMFDRWVRCAREIQDDNGFRFKIAVCKSPLWFLKSFLFFKNVFLQCCGNIPSQFMARVRK